MAAKLLVVFFRPEFWAFTHLNRGVIRTDIVQPLQACDSPRFTRI